MLQSFRRNMEGASIGSIVQDATVAVLKKPHESHPSLGHLVLLVFEAVMEVVCVSLPGYVVARTGQFDAEKQKFLANLNVMLFTPCLIFTKLASQLNGEKLVELGIIPIIFIIQTGVSYLVSVGISKAFGFNKRASNFVTAMGVFGNSNSLPISLVLSLSQTLKGLHWDKIPGDNDDEVAARGILYLMIFQQLGQLVRWSWGYHVLLAPKSKYEEYGDDIAEEGRRYEGGDALGSEETQGLMEGASDSDEHRSSDSDNYEPAGRTPVGSRSRTSLVDVDSSPDAKKKNGHTVQDSISTSASRERFAAPNEDTDGILSFPQIRNADDSDGTEGFKGLTVRAKKGVHHLKDAIAVKAAKLSHDAYEGLPQPAQTTLDKLKYASGKVYHFLWDFMNPPLWAMLIAVVVASIPSLQRLFFEEGSFIKNSVTSAISSSAGVAVPLILVVLGANLARNTQKREGADPEEAKMGKKLLIASLLSRMLIPTIIMAPILALFAKYVPISILDDPIFVIVAFLLTGAPSALQLAQICQINGVFENTMSKILFQSYVIWILPSTLVLVMIALEVVEWAK